MPDCCGAKLTTPFCPFCGKPADDPLPGLLHYVRKQLRRSRALQVSRNERVHPPRHLKASAKSVERWTAWEIALRAAIEELESLHMHDKRENEPTDAEASQLRDQLAAIRLQRDNLASSTARLAEQLAAARAAIDAVLNINMTMWVTADEHRVVEIIKNELCSRLAAGEGEA